MFSRETEPSDLDQALHRAYEHMRSHGVDSDEYAKIMRHVVTLQKLKGEETRKPLSNDTLALIGANLVGILIIVSYEHGHVMTSKALGFVPKTR